jgi:V/A-type H+-transporting ATPase subunit I
MMSKLDAVIEVCGNSGVFEPDDVFSFYSNTQNFSGISKENPYSEPLKRLKQALKDSGNGFKVINVDNFHVESHQVLSYVKTFLEKVEPLLDKKKEFQEKLQVYEKQIEQLKHFYKLGRSIDEIMECAFVKPRFGRLPLESYRKLESEKREDELLFFPCTQDEAYCWGIYFSPIDKADEVDRLFSGLYFESAQIVNISGTAEENVRRLQLSSEQILKEIEKVNVKMEELWSHQKGQCMRFYSKLEQLNFYHTAERYAARYNDSFMLVGWVPAEKESAICHRLDAIAGIEYSSEKGKDVLRHSPPIILRNRGFFRPFEFFVKTFGVPEYGEVDPTVFVGITYVILFGIMFADLGQGLILSIAGYLMWKIKNMHLGRIMIHCGISSAFFGMLFGSVFGFEDVLDGFYRNVFGLQKKPIEIMSPSAINAVIYSSVGIGFGLLAFVMIINVYSLFRQRKFGEAIFSHSGICGLVLYVSSAMVLADAMFLHVGFVNFLYAGGLIILPLVLILFSEVLIKVMNGRADWKPESWGDYISQSMFEVFEVMLSYVTNTMSFLRVGAFVLVHAGMMMVVFTIAEMFGTVGYTVTLVVGNLFVVCLEALLAGIQVLRLEFYELFSRFFAGSGRKFTPIAVERADN